MGTLSSHGILLLLTSITSQVYQLRNGTGKGLPSLILFSLPSSQLKRSGKLTSETAIKVSHKLGNALFAWETFFQKDIAIAYRVIMALLEFESKQQEDNLASSQDNKFLDVSYVFNVPLSEGKCLAKFCRCLSSLWVVA